MTKRARPVALVTGAKQGLGKASALHLASAGFDVIVFDLAAEADETISEIATHGVNAAYFKCDISDLDALPAIIANAWSLFGGIDCLVNNAGIAQRPLTDILDITPDQYDQVMDINLRGTFFITQEIAKRMLEDTSNHFRSIITISSIAARMVNLLRSPYHLAKTGLTMMTELYALRLAEAQVGVYEIRPGYMRTDMTASGVPAELDAAVRAGRVPERWWGTPDDVGIATTSLAKGALSYATGQAIWVDGGLHINRAD